VIAIRVQPRAGRDEIAGERDGAILVRVKAPPEGGRANKAVIKLLAKRLGVPQSAVEVARGAAARDKLIRVDGLPDDEARSLLLSNKRPRR